MYITNGASIVDAARFCNDDVWRGALLYWRVLCESELNLITISVF